MRRYDEYRDETRIIVGQVVSPEKLTAARQLRRQMTLAEARLWAGLRGRRLAGLRFRRQQIIDGFIVDFYCHAARLVIEVDGGIHRDQQGHDEARDRIFTSRGLRILRFTNDAVLERLDDVLTQIACTCTGTLADE